MLKFEMTDHNPRKDISREMSCVGNLHGFAMEAKSGFIELANRKYEAEARIDRAASSDGVLTILRQRGRELSSPIFCKGIMDTNLQKSYRSIAEQSLATFLAYGDAEVNKKPLKKLSLSFEYEHPTLGKVPYQNDYFFDPANDWLCVEIHERTGSNLRNDAYKRIVLDFQSPSSGVPQAIRWYDVKGDKESLTRTYNIKSITERDVKPEEYSLTAFGIPEPEASSFPSSVRWLLALAVVFACGAICFKYVSRKRA